MTKESGYPKPVRSGEDGFSKHGRGSEDVRKNTGFSPAYAQPQLPVSGGRSIAITGKDKAPGCHGFGHEGKQVDGVLRKSGDGRAHLVGDRRGKKSRRK
jgi:hypothetical protein